MVSDVRAAAAEAGGVESAYAWRRALVSLLIGTIGTIGLWSSVVVLPAVQAEFAVDRGSASIPYTVTMLGFAVGGVVMGRIADRFGIIFVVIGGAVGVCAGYLGRSEERRVG